MPTITLDNHTITVPQGTTLLSAAEQLGIDIPTLCYLKDLEPFASCMLCVVQEMRSGKLLPACSAQAQEGMVIETGNEVVTTARRNALELLMSEHTGDCEAPCRKGCPASMNIPLMLRQIANGEMEQAIRTVKADIALPAVMGRICPAPCEKVCNRAKLDGPVSICLLKRYAADEDLAETPWIPDCGPDNGKKIAVIGSGPAGLSAAYYLRLMGYGCTIYDKNEHPGGNLRYAVEPERLPHAVLDREIDVIARMGAMFKNHTEIGRDISITELQQQYEAIVLSIGTIDANTAERFGVECSDKGIRTDSNTLMTSKPGIFAGGSALRESKMAIRSAAQGKRIAESIHRYLNDLPVPENLDRYDSRTGKLSEQELNVLLHHAEQALPEQPKGLPGQGYTAETARQQAARCMHCDCRKPDTCKLRIYSRQYQADPKHYSGFERAGIELIDQHDLVIYEPGKCIKCGICVRITEQESENLGLAFVGRGFNVRVQSPFHSSLNDALQQTALKCAQSCPTGAISLKRET